MSKLSDTTSRARKYLIGFFVFAFAIIILQFILRYVNNKYINPPSTVSPYAYADNKFGTIEYPQIASLAISDSSSPAFSIQGSFPESPSSVNVYQVGKPRETLGNAVQAQDLAETLGFQANSTLDGNILTWLEGQKRLDFNKINKKIDYLNYSVTTGTKPDVVDSQKIDSQMDSIISQLKISQINKENSTRSYLSLSNDNYSQANNAEKSDFLRQDYYSYFEIASLKASTATGQTSSTTTSTGEQALKGRIYNDNPTQGSNYLIIANTNANLTSAGTLNQVLREYHSTGYTVLETGKGIYAAKTYEEAWENVKDGEASLKYLVPDGEDPYQEYQNLTITRFIVNPDKSELGYYLTNDWTGYIYPIYIFRGVAELSDGKSAEFVFYTSAVSKN